MHLAIDDTHGPERPIESRYVTGDRRTHVGVIFKDEEVENVRYQMRHCLGLAETFGVPKPAEFHFVDIYNRQPPWDLLPPHANLGLIEGFAHIYSIYRWPVIVSTVDARTFADHGAEPISAKFDGLDLSRREDQSLVMLCVKFKAKYKSPEPQSLNVHIDEGRAKPGTGFGHRIFHDWVGPFTGAYASSAEEPLLQIADFVAYCVNRSTHLATKANRSEIDNWFMHLIGSMSINSSDISIKSVDPGFTTDDFDEFHRLDRVKKQLE
jgi:hypothetical protein